MNGTSKRYIHLVWLLAILLASIAIRTFTLSDIPHGFFADEASIGYNAYTIGHTAKDEHGKFLPFFFEAFGEYKNPVATYVTVLFVLLFGLSEWSVRLVSALFGVASIFGIYLLTKQLFKKEHDHKIIALLASFLLTISPWSIHLSRVLLEGIMAYVFFTTMAVYFFLRSQENFRKFFLLSVLFFSLAFYSYFPARLFIPFLFLSLLVVFYKKMLRKNNLTILVVAGVVLFICSIPILKSFYDQTLLNRWEQVSIFTNPKPGEDPLFHVAKNYLSHFSLDFLFLRGDSGMEGQTISRHSVRGFGELFLIQFPLIIAGVIFMIKKERLTLLLLSGWMLLYPLGSMFTTDTTAQATRSIIGLIPLTIFSGIGTWYVMKKAHHLAGFLGKITTVFLFAIIISCSILYLKSYFFQYNSYSSDFWGWQYGPRDIMQYFLVNKDKYDDMYMSGEFNGADIFVKFYDPKNKCLGKCKIGDFMRETTLYQPDRKQLFSLSPDYISKSLLRDKFYTLKTIYYPNQTVAFKIGVIVQ